MTNRKAQLQALGALADLMLDSRLVALRAAAEARNASLARLDALNATPAATDLPLIAEALASLGYQRWADARRAEINLVLARQTAEWLEARDAARTTFGRKQALQGLATRLEGRRKSPDQPS